MKKMAALLAGAILMLAAGTASALTITYSNNLGDGGYTTPYASVTVETFDNASLKWSWSGNYQIVSGSESGLYSAPAYNNGVSDIKDATKYISVPKNVQTNPLSATVTDFGADYNYFGIWWGSMDGYNSFEFTLDGNLVKKVTGFDLAAGNLANGDQFAPGTNRYVNFDFGTEKFDSITMTSTNYAFEADNMAIGAAPVPEPGTIMLLGAGLAGLGLYSRRRAKK
ncbi:PEP-CTERM motif protein [Geobacter sp. OR-1]|uniref:Npun_F0296 family exosortase-dependent surface protein n=1 Tax=Geobacter sp. OR-1 TaxID=1266765 RepID=UPI000544509C|nr:PEP-CTERM sorting domain-containing protein [Geobacter sp. OR-1]GAM11163.1 PEP-CTERM motif protein [Geobacter sp. OR-1]